jgi:hypothetical protein
LDSPPTTQPVTPVSPPVLKSESFDLQPKAVRVQQVPVFKWKEPDDDFNFNDLLHVGEKKSPTVQVPKKTRDVKTIDESFLQAEALKSKNRSRPSGLTAYTKSIGHTNDSIAEQVFALMGEHILPSSEEKDEDDEDDQDPFSLRDAKVAFLGTVRQMGDNDRLTADIEYWEKNEKLLDNLNMAYINLFKKMTRDMDILYFKVRYNRAREVSDLLCKNIPIYLLLFVMCIGPNVYREIMDFIDVFKIPQEKCDVFIMCFRILFAYFANFQFDQTTTETIDHYGYALFFSCFQDTKYVGWGTPEFTSMMKNRGSSSTEKFPNDVNVAYPYVHELAQGKAIFGSAIFWF